MFIKKAIIVVLILALGLSLYGCGAVDVMKNLLSEEDDIEIVRSDDENYEITSDANMRDTVLYFQNENGYLVPVKRQIPWEEGIAKAALSNMIDSPIIREDVGMIGLLPVIPAGTQIRGMAVDQETGLCKVDFSMEVMNYQSKTEEENLIRSVVYTLTEFPAISQVQFMFDGKVLSELKYGTKVGSAIEREDINSVDVGEAGASKVVVYYKGTSNGEYEYYVPVTVPTLAPTTNILTSLEELFKGAPELSGLYTDIPEGVILQGVEVRDSIAYVDLAVESKDSIPDQASFDRMSKNIGLTLGEFEEIESVEILIDGKTIDKAGYEFNGGDTLPVFANEY